MRSRAGVLLSLAGSTVAFAALTAAPAFSYVRTTTLRSEVPMKWSDPRLTVDLHVSEPPEYLDEEQVLRMTRAAAAAWSAPQVACTSLRLEVLPVRESEALVDADRRNRITFRRTTWCKEPREPSEPCYDPMALAITSVFAQVKDGRIVDSDIEINAAEISAAKFRWSDVAADAAANNRRPNTQDLQNVLTHELGHLIGLDHTCYMRGSDRPRPRDHDGQLVPDCGPSAPNRVQETTMYASAIPGDLDKRSLESDDLKAVCEVYPSGDSDEGGCAVVRGASGRSGVALAGLGLVIAGLVRWRRRR